MMKNHEKFLEAFQKFLNETPDEELDKMIDEVEEKTKGMEGPTVDEYMEMTSNNPVLLFKHVRDEEHMLFILKYHPDQELVKKVCQRFLNQNKLE